MKEAADPADGCSLILVKACAYTEVQINACHLHVLFGIGLIPEPGENFGGFLRFILLQQHESFKQEIFRIFAAGLLKAVQFIVAAYYPG